MNPEIWQSLDTIFATKYKAKTSWESTVFENYIVTLKHECRFLKNYSLNDLKSNRGLAEFQISASAKWQILITSHI